MAPEGTPFYILIDKCEVLLHFFRTQTRLSNAGLFMKLLTEK